MLLQKCFTYYVGMFFLHTYNITQVEYESYPFKLVDVQLHSTNLVNLDMLDLTKLNRTHFTCSGLEYVVLPITHKPI